MRIKLSLTSNSMNIVLQSFKYEELGFPYVFISAFIPYLIWGYIVKKNVQSVVWCVYLFVCREGLGKKI